MKRIIIKHLTSCLFLALLGVGLTAPERCESAPQTARGEDLSESEAARVLDAVFRGRPHEALDYLETLEGRSSAEPLFHILRARCHQEFIPMDDANKEPGQAISAPALADLDTCIEICTRRIESEDPDSRLYFYRGWAWMAKAYVRSMTRDLYTAGREAKHGKKDLERYLESNPDDPTAKGMLGAFLYFADTIPGAFKLLSKLLLLPTGDRDKGLEYLQTAVRGGGLLETDWKLILYNVYFFFEGRYEEGLSGLQAMLEIYPEYPRTAIPLAVSRPYAPNLAARHDSLVESTIIKMYSAPNREVDWNALYLVQLFRAYGDHYCNHSRATVARLRSIIHEAPRHPDWVSSFARLELGRLYASRGDRKDAVEMFESVVNGGKFEFLRKEAETLIEDTKKFKGAFDGEPLPDMDPWISAIYRSDPDSLGGIRSRFAELAPKSVAARFYTAECDLLSEDFERALENFTDVISIEAPAWDHAYQMIASTRIAEIYASTGHYKTAARYVDIALGYYHNEYLLDWVLQGRKRYFERLSEGKEPGPPTLLSMRSGCKRSEAHRNSRAGERVDGR